MERGSVAGVALDGLNFSVYVKWPGAIHEGHGEGLILVDERADDRQRAAVATLVRGEAGGPWGVLAWTWPTVHGPVAVPYVITVNGLASRLKAGNAVELEFGTITNPVNGKDVHPGVVLPEGLIVKKADLGCSKVFRVGEGIALDHSGQYTAVGPFEYAFP